MALFDTGFTIRTYFFDNARRIPGNDRHGRDVFRHDTVGSDYGTVSYPYAWQNRRIYSDPHLVLDNDRFSVGSAAVFGIRIVIDGYQIHFRADKYAIADGYATSAEKGTTCWIKQSSPMVTGLP